MAWYSNLVWFLAQAAAPAAEVPAGDEDGMSGTLRLIVAVGILVGSFVLGNLIASGLRMQDYGFKIGLVIFALVAGVAIVYFGWPPKRGIDLSGGVVLVYEVDTSATSTDWMQSAVKQINEKLNAEGGERLEARPIGEGTIEIIVPKGVGAADVEEKIAALRDSLDVTLNLESQEVKDGSTVLVYQAHEQQQRSLDMSKLIGAVGRRINPGGVKELTIRQYGTEQIEVIIPEVEEREVEQIKKKISTSGLLNFRIVANPTDDRELIKAGLRTTGRDVYIGGRLEGRWVKAGPDLREDMPEPRATYRPGPGGGDEILVRIDPFNVDGRYLTRAAPGTDQKGGLSVDFSFDSVGAEKFRQLTSRNLPDDATGLQRHLGIILDNEMLSAPTIQTTISNRGQIHGSFTNDYVEFLVGVLNAGSLPASLRPEPISEQRISAQLGDDTIRAGANAMIISTAAILLFMLVYYRFAGMVADVAVTLNVIITVGLMILIKAAFTLPGLAGLVLTVGMAVDANVLIYERIREESERGASLRMAIRNGFSRATGTIVDANITTLITAIVLYVIGTDQIKGFAVTLILGLLVSMFTAIFVARVIFDIAERKRLLTRLTMMRIVGHTSFDFIRWRGPAMTVSLLLIAVGVGATVMRGKELLDIDFTGGSSVQIVFAEGKSQPIADVRTAVAELPDVAVSSVGEGDREFKVDTSDNDVAHVQSVLQQTFKSSLETYTMSYGELAMIGPDDASGSTGEETTKPAAAAKPAAKAPAAEPAAKRRPNRRRKKAIRSPGPQRRPATKPGPESEPAAPEGDQSSAARHGPFQFASFLQEESNEEPAGEEKPAEKRRRNPKPPAESSDEKPPEPAEEKPAEAPPAEEKPEPDTAPKADEEAKPEMKDEAPADEPLPVEPVEKAEIDKQPPQAESSLEEAEAAAEEPAGPASYVGGTRVELTFPEAIAHEPLREMVQQQLDVLGEKEAGFQLSNAAVPERQRSPLRKVVLAHHARQGPDAKAAGCDPGEAGQHAGVSLVERNRRQGGRRHADDGDVRHAGQHGDDRRLRVDPLPERDLRPGGRRGIAARRAGVGRVSGGQRLSVAVYGSAVGRPVQDQPGGRGGAD